MQRIPTEILDFYDAIQERGSSDISYSDVMEYLSLWDEANANSHAGAHGLFHRYLGNLKKLTALMVSSNKNDFEFRCTVLPFMFASHDGDTVLLINCINANVLVNTLQARSSRDRSVLICKRCVAPTLCALHHCFGDTDVRYYGIVVGYASSNFLDKVGTLRLERTAVVVSARLCAQYARGRITFEDLLRSAVCYVSDRNTMRLMKTRLP